jgi:hypothetical protein
MPTPSPTESLTVFVQSAGLRSIQSAMFKAWLTEFGYSAHDYRVHTDWQALYRQALTTVVQDYSTTSLHREV